MTLWKSIVFPQETRAASRFILDCNQAWNPRVARRGATRIGATKCIRAYAEERCIDSVVRARQRYMLLRATRVVGLRRNRFVRVNKSNASATARVNMHGCTHITAALMPGTSSQRLFNRVAPYRRKARAPPRFDVGQQLDSVHPRQRQIQQHQARRVFAAEYG